jgi:hypothetical protein
MSSEILPLKHDGRTAIKDEEVNIFVNIAEIFTVNLDLNVDLLLALCRQ